MTHKQNVKRLASIIELVQSKIGPADELVRGLIEMVAQRQPLTGAQSYTLMCYSLEDGSAPWARVAWVARMINVDCDELDADIAYTALALQDLSLNLELKLNLTQPTHEKL